MRYFLDTEFNSSRYSGYDGQILSLGLIREDGLALYTYRSFNDAPFGLSHPKGIDPWVLENVIPIIDFDGLEGITILYSRSLAEMSCFLEEFLKGDDDVTIVTDWPDDVSKMCELFLTGPGKMIAIPGVKFEIERVDAYPTDLPGAIQHNSYWDAAALRYKLTGRTDLYQLQHDVNGRMISTIIP